MNQAATRSRRNGVSGAGHGTVLVIDDDGSQREGLAELLSHDGFDVVVAGDGQAGLDLLRDGLRPKLVVLDLVMPRMDGWSFLGHLRGPMRSSVPVLVMSGEARTRAPAEADACLEKPLDPTAFSSAVERLLVEGEGALRGRNGGASDPGVSFVDLSTGRVSRCAPDSPTVNVPAALGSAATDASLDPSGVLHFSRGDGAESTERSSSSPASGRGYGERFLVRLDLADRDERGWPLYRLCVREA